MRTRDCSVVGMALAMTVLATGCLDRELKPLNPCLVSGVSRKVTVNNIDKVDLLFMVDNSNSMAEEQESLKLQFPKLINVLTTGERMPGDPDPFPPAKDLHVGVVSSDMGIPGVNFGQSTNCLPDGGDDGKLLHTPRGSTCDAAYPSFLSYSAMLMTNKAKFANDFQCIASLGTGGCGFEQQLEASLKALWPSIFRDANGNVITPNPITFLSTTAQGTLGRGDLPAAQGGNAGFLRNDPATGLSLIAILLVTDEEDCSSRISDHLKPKDQYPMDSPYYSQDLNLRCFKNPQVMYDLATRYLKGFQLLRQGRPELVVYAAITGVPVDLVDKKALEAVPDWGDDAARDRFYDKILSDTRMQEVEDPGSMPGSGVGNLIPSCQRPDPKTGVISKAFPPRRIVQLAKMFGANGVVQSICQEDFGAAMDAIINVIAKQLGAVCLPRKLVRQSNGKVGCDVVWELPLPGTAPASTFTECAQAPYLETPTGGRALKNDRMGNNCTVKQLEVSATAPGSPAPPGDGWYYDTFTEELQTACNKTEPQRVAFSPGAKPPTGVVVKLECLNETQRLANTQKNVNTARAQPEIGSPCGKDVMMPGAPFGDDACFVSLLDNTVDMRMFCHRDTNTCVRGCVSPPDCPAAWDCDDRPETVTKTEGKAFCVNPTCGTN